MNAHTVLEPVPDVIAEEVDGEWIIVPVNAQGIGDADDALYTLNETGRWLWQAMDGKRSLGEIADEMARHFDPVPDRDTRIEELIAWTASMLEYGLLKKKLKS